MMSKQEFLEQLKKGLSGLPQADIEEQLNFYGEMIDGRIEEGFSEEDAISEIGNISEIIQAVLADIPLSKLVKEKITPKRKLRAWEITLIILGIPFWFPILSACFAVVFSLYIVLWSLIISLWAIEVSIFACAFGGFVSGVIFILYSNALTGCAFIGISLVCVGVSIFFLYGCKFATKGCIFLTKKIILGSKNLFINKEEA